MRTPASQSKQFTQYLMDLAVHLQLAAAEDRSRTIGTARPRSFEVGCGAQSLVSGENPSVATPKGSVW